MVHPAQTHEHGGPGTGGAPHRGTSGETAGPVAGVFADRVEAGNRLAERLRYLAGAEVVILGVARGGVAVAAVVAHALDAPLDVVVVRKVGVPWYPEIAMGAVAEGGVRVVDDEVVAGARVDPARYAEAEAKAGDECRRLTSLLRVGRDPIPLRGRVAVVVDDGLATGTTARAAAAAVRARGASRVVLAVPVAARPALGLLRSEHRGDGAASRSGFDEVVAVRAPRVFRAVGEWYADFRPVTDREVVGLLASEPGTGHLRPPAVEPPGVAGSGAAGPGVAGSGVDDPTPDGVLAEEVWLGEGAVRLAGTLTSPPGARGLVVIAHGSGSSRHSPRNRRVASALTEAGLATLLFDALTTAEEARRDPVFDVPLLGGRLAAVTRAVRHRYAWVGYFGASTGAAAALWAAAEPDADVVAVVSRGGRPDLVGARLADVRAPVLLVVGERDPVVLGLNRAAQERMRCDTELVVIPGAGHLFAEPGALDVVAAYARDWFVSHATASVGGAAPRPG